MFPVYNVARIPNCGMETKAWQKCFRQSSCFLWDEALFKSVDNITMEAAEHQATRGIFPLKHFNAYEALFFIQFLVILNSQEKVFWRLD